MHSVVRKLMVFSVALAALFASSAALALDTGDIVVKSVKGEVHVTMNGAEQSVRAGSVLELPASVRTGRDGAIDLAQGATTVSVGPETLLEFPALEKRGDPIDKIVQPRGNAFYNVGKREGRRLRVETPYLVAVIKGTQFNVAALDGSATISLFEGLLEIRDTGGGEVIDIKAGEIAARKRGEKSISVIKMDGKAAPTQRAPAGASAGNGSTPAAARVGDEQTLALVDQGLVLNTGATLADNVRGVTEEPGVRVDARGEAGAASVGANVNLGTTGLDVGTAAADLSAGVGGNAGAATVDAGTNFNAGAAGVEVAANVGLGLGSGGVDVGATANVDLGAGAASAGAAANVDPGSAAADVGTGVVADVGAGNVGAGVDLGASANVGGATVVDAGANAAVNLGAGNLATDVDVGANVGGVAAGVTAGVDLAAGNVDLGVNLGGINLGVNLDLDLDDGNNGHGNDSDHDDSSNPGHGGGNHGAPAPPTTPVIDVGGLLDGILNRHRKK